MDKVKEKVKAPFYVNLATRSCNKFHVFFVNIDKFVDKFIDIKNA